MQRLVACGSELLTSSIPSSRTFVLLRSMQPSSALQKITVDRSQAQNSSAQPAVADSLEQRTAKAALQGGSLCGDRQHISTSAHQEAQEAASPLHQSTPSQAVPVEQPKSKRDITAARAGNNVKKQKVQGARLGRPVTPKSGKAGTTDLGQGSFVCYHPAAFSRAERDQLFDSLKADIDWEAREVRVMGRSVMQPRLVAYMADHASLTYTYSGNTMVPRPWNDTVSTIKKRVEEVSGAQYNSCLLNYYRSGGDHMSFHSDNESLYGKEPMIGSASFGTPRDFVLRRNSDHGEKIAFELGSGDVLVMKGTTQQHWMHAVPKRNSIPGSRINLTFRKIVFPQS